jgi:hypothetical protein
MLPLSVRNKVALVLGLVVFFASVSGILLLLSSDKPYGHSTKWNTYDGSEISFSYPSQWKLNVCNEGGTDIILPGTIKGTFTQDGQPLELLGFAHTQCAGGSLQRVKKTQVKWECIKKTQGIRLANNTYLYVKSADYAKTGEQAEYVTISEDSCRSKYSTSLFTFRLYPLDGSIKSSDILEHGEPRVDASVFYGSQQYKDIKRFAESITLK